MLSVAMHVVYWLSSSNLSFAVKWGSNTVVSIHPVRPSALVLMSTWNAQVSLANVITTSNMAVATPSCACPRFESLASGLTSPQHTSI